MIQEAKAMCRCYGMWQAGEINVKARWQTELIGTWTLQVVARRLSQCGETIP